MPPKKDQAPIYIDGPKMDWSMDDGLCSRLECELILDGELAEIAEPRKTQDTDQDSTVLHPSFSARNVTNMDISPASASQNHRGQM